MDTNLLTEKKFKSIRHILTLRYDPYLKNNLPKLTSKNFSENEESANLKLIKNSIKSEINNNTNKKQKISISLSSGIDSTLVGIILRNTFPNKEINAFSIKFSNSFDETKKSKIIAEKLGFNHKIIEINNFFKFLPEAIFTTKLPFWDLHWYNLAKNVSGISDILISGDGGDELFGGYTFRYSKYLSLINSNSTINEKILAYLNCHERDWVPDQKNIFTKKFDFSWEEFLVGLTPFFKNDLSEINQVILADYNGKLQHNMYPLYKLIHKKFELGYLAPILSKKLINYSTKLKTQEKYDPISNIGKIPLRRLIDEFGFKKFIESQKYGFSVNTKNIWLSEGQNLCKYFFDNSRIVKDGLIQESWIKKYLNKKDLEYRYVNKFFGLLAFEIWYRLFITKEMKPNETLLN